MEKRTHLEAPSTPTSSSNLPETKDYLDYLVKTDASITIRELIGFWGFRARGSNVVKTVNIDLEKMGVRVAPPINSGPLGTHVMVMKLEKSSDDISDIDPPDDHLLSISRIESTTYALQESNNDDSAILKWFTRDTPIQTAVTLMTRMDFSQVPVVDNKDHFHPIGAFTWESFSQATLQGAKPKNVGDAMTTAHMADLASDLFNCIELVASGGFILATHLGRLTGIVTPNDLIDELRDLTKPFLAIGRCERELRRVAIGALGSQLKRHKKGIEGMTFGDIQYFYKDHWEDLNWCLEKDEFISWINDTRNLRNRIAHFESQDWNYVDEIESVNRLTKWLSNLRFNTDQDSTESDAPEVLAAKE